VNYRHITVAFAACVVAAAACTEPTVPSPTRLEPSLAMEAARRPGACPALPKWTTSIALSPSALTVEVGATRLLAVKDQAGADIAPCAVTWGVTPNYTVATVSDSGVVTGVSAGGPVTVTASVSGKGKRKLQATGQVTVSLAAVASVTLAPASVDLTIGATRQLSVELRDARGNVLTGRTVTWSAATPGVASVSAAGLVNAVSLGQGATITATSEGVSGSAVVNVNPVPLTSLALVASWWEGSASRIYKMRGDGASPTYLETGIAPSVVGNIMLARGGYFGENVIYAMDSTGANKRQIVGAGPSYLPDLSPDGSRLTLMYGDCPGGHPLAIASASGAGIIGVNSSYCTSIAPRWSPLGDRILFAAGGNAYTVRTDFTDQRLVTALPAGAGITWAPNGTQFYLSAKVGTSTTSGIYRIDADGTNLTPISIDTGHDDFIADVTPLGDWIVFYRNGEIWVMTTAGTQVTRVAASGTAQEGVRWVRPLAPS